MAVRRRTKFEGLSDRANRELTGLQDELVAEHKNLRDEVVGVTSNDKVRGTYGVRFSERVRCLPDPTAGLDLTFPAADPVTQNRWIEVLHQGGGDVRITATRGLVQGVATLTLNTAGLYYFSSDGKTSWWSAPIGSGGATGIDFTENAGPVLGNFDTVDVQDGAKILVAPTIAGTTIRLGWTIAPGSLALSDLTTIAAQSYLGNPTGGAASAQAIAVSAESVVGRTSGNLGQITSAVQTVLMRAAGSVFWGAAAANQVFARLGGDLGFQNISTFAAALGLLSGVALQVVTAAGAGTYTPTSGMKFVLVIGTGGGGGSGGADATSAATPGDAAAAGGAGAGGTCIELFNAATIGASQPYVVGAGGTAGANTGGNGGSGTTTTFGTAAALFSAQGGAPGTGTGTVTTNANRASGGVGGTPTGGQINIVGGDGGDGWAAVSDDATAGNEFIIGMAGEGGASFWGGGARGQTVASGGNFAATNNTAGLPGRAFGSGASGALCFNSTTGAAGAVGATGIMVFIEFT